MGRQDTRGDDVTSDCFPFVVSDASAVCQHLHQCSVRRSEDAVVDQLSQSGGMQEASEVEQMGVMEEMLQLLREEERIRDELQPFV